jgi:hypothetical protein
MKVKELAELTDFWLDKYHFYCPHESLKFLALAEYCYILELSILYVANVL